MSFNIHSFCTEDQNRGLESFFDPLLAISPDNVVYYYIYKITRACYES